MMRLTLTLAALTTALGYAPAADDATARKAAKELEGKYELTKMARDGTDQPADVLKQVTGVEITATELVLHLPGKDDKATFRLDPTQKPAHIDLTAASGELRPGVYKVEKGELVIVFNVGGKDRPTDFDGKGERVIKLVLKKK